ncbi:MAG: N-acetyltransferase [SAR86 cluster bacterium]|uniref:N-acetyltransferase n=1 Tax=SAR86 cluster bacterium TaxID=2030880 RepID=A0A2A5ALU6_9GAMM|nr:MAG: N-acetyltransferase [SAR86 cluster bacterium]
MEQKDLREAAEIHKETFSRQRHSYQWLESSLKAFPRFFCFVIDNEDSILGYIIWAQKSGFRPATVLDLDQIAVHPKCQSKGIGKALIVESLPLVKDQLANQNSDIKHITVNTRADNFSQNLYKKTLKAEVEAVIKNLYSADEVFMIARNVSI